MTSLQPGQECTADVEFVPTATGAATGTLTFTGAAGTQKLTLTGTGTSAAPTTYFTPAAVTSAQTPLGDQTEFYNPYYGSSVYFYNNGASPLTIASAQVTAGGSSHYISPFTDNCTAVAIQSGSACTLQVYFAPTVAGYETGAVTLPDTTNKTYTLPLFGYAPAVLDSGYLTPASLAFPSQALGTISSAMPTITLTNSGSTNRLDRILFLCSTLIFRLCSAAAISEKASRMSLLAGIDFESLATAYPPRIACRPI